MKKLTLIFGLLLSFIYISAAGAQSVTVDGQDISVGSNRSITNDDVSDLANVNIVIDNEINIGTDNATGLLNFGGEDISYSGDFTITNNAEIIFGSNTGTNGAVINFDNFGNENPGELNLLINNNDSMATANAQSVVYVRAKENSYFSTTINNKDRIFANGVDSLDAIRLIMNEDDNQSSVNIFNTEPDVDDNNRGSRIISDSGRAIHIENGGDHNIENANRIESETESINILFSDNSTSNVTIENSSDASITSSVSDSIAFN